MNQDARKVLWVDDQLGNFGKSFLANYLSINYSYLIFDGTMPTRDVALFIDDDVKGVAFDVPRDAVAHFNYGILEALKNGFMSTGKYNGKICRFKPTKVVVFSNFPPDRTKLSRDRWDTLTIGEGELLDISNVPIVSPDEEFPFMPPEPVPDLTENFSARKYICRHMPQYVPREEHVVQPPADQQQPPEDQPLPAHQQQPPEDQPPPAHQQQPPEGEPPAHQQVQRPPVNLQYHNSQTAGRSTAINLTQTQHEMRCEHNCDLG